MIKALKSKKLKSNAGFSLIEAIIVIGISGMTLTAIVATLTYSIKSNAEARYRSLASNAANQAMEVMVREKFLRDWSSFKTLAGGATSGTYCFNTLPNPGVTPIGGSCGSYPSGFADLGLNAGITFRRTVYVSSSGDQVDVKVKVSWNMNDTTTPSQECEAQCVEINRTFYRYE